MTVATIEGLTSEPVKFEIGDLVEYATDKPEDHYVLMVTDFDSFYDTFAGVVIVPNKTSHQEIGYCSSFVTKGFRKFNGTISLKA